ncbi:hypothetical protein D3C80_886630 [compost metagenome]
MAAVTVGERRGQCMPCGIDTDTSIRQYAAHVTTRLIKEGCHQMGNRHLRTALTDAQASCFLHCISAEGAKAFE